MLPQVLASATITFFLASSHRCLRKGYGLTTWFQKRYGMSQRHSMFPLIFRGIDIHFPEQGFTRVPGFLLLPRYWWENTLACSNYEFQELGHLMVADFCRGHTPRWSKVIFVEFMGTIHFYCVGSFYGDLQWSPWFQGFRLTKWYWMGLNFKHFDNLVRRTPCLFSLVWSTWYEEHQQFIWVIQQSLEHGKSPVQSRRSMQIP